MIPPTLPIQLDKHFRPNCNRRKRCVHGHSIDVANLHYLSIVYKPSVARLSFEVQRKGNEIRNLRGTGERRRACERSRRHRVGDALICGVRLGKYGMDPRNRVKRDFRTRNDGR